jgi:hypothetical protein
MAGRTSSSRSGQTEAYHRVATRFLDPETVWGLPSALGQATILVRPDRIFNRPTSVIVCGSNRPLLNWVAYALASITDPGFIWTDVRLQGEVLADADPLSRNLIPPDRMNVVHPKELALHRGGAKAVAESVIRADEPTDTVRRLADFLRLPLHTQRLLSAGPSQGQPMVLVLSNGHRLVAFYPTDAVGPTVRAIVESGATLIMTFADAPPEGRLVFETVLHLEGNDTRGWRQASLTAEKGPADGPLRSGSAYRLGEFDPVTDILASGLG